MLCAFPTAACNKRKDALAPRVWGLQPQSLAAEEEVKKMLRNFDAAAFVSFVPATDLDARVKAAMEKEDAPDVFMLYADAIPSRAEEKRLVDLSYRLPLSNVKTDELSESARKACLYQGKTWGVPLFTDVYMLAVNRALVPTAPDTFEQFCQTAAALTEQQTTAVDKLTPQKQALLFEAALCAHDGKMLNARQTALTFTDDKGEAALGDVTSLLQSTADAPDAIGDGKAAFSILTTSERRALSEKCPDAEIALAPLFGVNRLQTVALCINPQAKDQKRAFALLEFLQGKSDELSALYKCYGAKKDLLPLSTQDEDAVVQLAQARPAPDLCGYDTLLSTYLPAAIDKAGKGVPAVDCLAEAAQISGKTIWPGKRE